MIKPISGKMPPMSIICFASAQCTRTRAEKRTNLHAHSKESSLPVNATHIFVDQLQQPPKKP